MIVIAGVLGTAHAEPIMRSGRLVAGRGRGPLIAVHLADEPEHGSRSELQKQHEGERA
jgi:hypothetical protein